MSIVGGSKPWYNTAHSNNGMRKALIVMFWTRASLAWIKMSFSAAAVSSSSVHLSVCWDQSNGSNCSSNKLISHHCRAKWATNYILPLCLQCSQKKLSGQEDFPRKNFPEFMHWRNLILCTSHILSSTWTCRRSVQVKFLDYPDSFCIIRTDFGLSG